MDQEQAMRRALLLAARGRATVSPNPMAGCVLLAADGTVVGEGWHDRPGGPHAEVAALRAAGPAAGGSTAVVTLEPCAHTGRTGPCAQALIDAGVARVLVALTDPNPVAAGGCDVLRAAGIPVETGLLHDEAARLNAVFLHGIAHGRPYVVLKAAQSLDGRMAAADGTSQWLTGPGARDRAHALRAAADAVVVGSGTALADDPLLTVRRVAGGLPLDDAVVTQPLRVLVDRRGRVPATAKLFDDAAPTLRWDGDLPDLLAALWAKDVRSVLVEGGPTLQAAFWAAGLVDEVVLMTAPVLLGAGGRPLLGGWGVATLTDAPRLRVVSVERVGDDTLTTLLPVRERG